MLRRGLSSLVVSLGLLLTLAASALATTGGDDGEITFFSFAVIAFFPLVALVLSLIQAALDRRKERRKSAAIRRRAGW